MAHKKITNSKKSGSEKIGYARVSTIGQNLDSQIDILKEAGCIRIFEDKITGVSRERKGWDELMNYIRPGDTLVITELSRMSRSLMHLLQIIKELEVKKVSLVSIRENIDTESSVGRCFLSIMGAISQMERELRAERSAAGRKSAKARGRTGGRPKTDPEKLEQARILYENSEKTAAQVCKTVGIGRRTMFAYIARKREG